MGNLFENEELLSSSSPVIWNASTESGLGDRLLNVIFMLTVCRKINSPLYLEWKRYGLKSIDAQFRAQDILLENILSKLTFPNDLHIVNPGKIPSSGLICNKYGSSVNTCEFYSGYANEFFKSLQEFQQNVLNVAKNIQFKNKINTPTNLVTIHIRRTDKVRPRDSGLDGFMIACDELEELNNITINYIKDLSKTYKHYYIAGDDPKSTEWFKQHIIDQGLFLYTPPLTQQQEQWEQTYTDLQIMANSKVILQSQKNSSFSRLASYIGNNKLINVFYGESMCI